MHVFYRPGKGGSRVAPKADDRVIYASLTAAPPPQDIKISQTLQAAVLKTAEVKPDMAKVEPVKDIVAPKLTIPAQPAAAKLSEALVGED